MQAIITKSRMLDEVPGSQEFKKDLLLTLALAAAKQVIEPRRWKATDTHIGPWPPTSRWARFTRRLEQREEGAR
ncbi:MAG: hypothetical protein U0797_04925 [Gemmataceae bacterium]